VIQTHLTWPDWVVLATMLAALLGLGYWKGGNQATTKDFFLARRQIPWWAACLSFVATEVSAVTLISVPATAFMENWEYAQFFIGSTAARFVIAYLFIPAFYHYNCTTIYEFLKHRFGAETQVTATIFFFITRLLGSGVRFMVAALALSVLLGWPIIPAILLFLSINVAYVMYGGMKSTVWTGTLQASTYIVVGLATIGYIAFRLPGGWSELFHTAAAAGKLRVWDWGPAWSDPGFVKNFFKDPNIVWLAIANGFFGSMAAFGTDQELMSRLLTVETRSKSQRAMVATPIASGIVLLIYLTIGASLYSFYAGQPGLPLPAKLDGIFPHFIAHSMPVLLRGLLLWMIALASMDTPLASLTASFVTDIYRPVIHPNGTEDHYLRLSRVCVGVFAVILALIAYGFSFYQKFLWLAFKIGGVTFGSLLGVFLLGFLTKRPSNRANILGMTLMAVINAVLLVLSEKGIVPLGWTWLLMIGTLGTFGIGYVLGPRMEASVPG
jgi:solute:Na+ symporter, SSS family